MISALTLLLVTQVSAEWVEISQQHYRKPIRTHSPFVTSDKVIDVEDTTKSWAYNNHSVTEYNWNKSPTRAPNIANVKRVQHIENIVKTTDINKFEEEPDTNVDTTVYDLKPNYGLMKSTSKFNGGGKQKATVVKVPNLGNVKRVQLNNNPVKSPPIDFKGERGKNHNRYEKEPNQDHDLQTVANEFEDKKATETYNRRIYVSNIKKHSTDRTATFPPDIVDTSPIEEVNTFNRKSTKQEYKNYTAVKNLYTVKPTFMKKTENFNNYETQKNRFYKVTESWPTEVTENVNMITTEAFDDDDEFITKHNGKMFKPTTEKPTKKNSYKNKGNNVIDFETESQENKVHPSENNEKQIILVKNDHKTNTKANNVKSKQDPQPENSYQNENIKQNKDKKDKTAKDSNKVHTMENVVKFMKVVADTISKNSRRSFGGKMQYLHELKDSILANIEDRIDSTWPDDDSTTRRRSRSAQASPRGHVQIPSSESALMTISFLTFAVFLIKLVLQVIHTYKNKAMMVAPLVVAAGRNVFSRHGHH